MTGQIASTAAEKPWKNTRTPVLRWMMAGNCAIRMLDDSGGWHIFRPTAAGELESFGADPLEVTAEEFAGASCARGARRIKALLLDQTVLRGVGNIYADESLWRARIHPAKSARI